MHLNCIAFVLIGFVAVSADPAKNDFVIVAQTPTFDRDNGSFPRRLSTQASTGLGVEEKSLMGSPSSSPIFVSLSSDVRQAGLWKNFASKTRIAIQSLHKPPSAKDAYYIFGLDTVKGNLLQHLKWKFWAVYVGKQHRNDPDGAIVKAMSDQLGVSQFMSIVAHGAMEPSTLSIASNLEQGQHERWLASRVTPVDVLRELEIQDSSNVFTSLLYPTWSRYVKAFQHKYPSQDITELGALRTILHNRDVKLLKMLSSIGNVNHPASTNVVNEFAPIWMKELQKPEQVCKTVMAAFEETTGGQVGTQPKTVFQKLLDKGRFNNPLLTVWVEYMIVFTKKTNYADETISNWIEALISSGKAGNGWSRRIMHQTMDEWLASDIHPYVVFKMFKLDDKNNIDRLLDNPLVYLYTEYMERYVTEQLTVVGTLKHFFGHKQVAIMLQAAKDAPNERTAKTAGELYKNLLLGWYTHGRIPKDISTTLELKSTVEAYNELCESMRDSRTEIFSVKP